MAQAKRPSGVTAPPTGKLPTATVLPWGWSTRPLGRLRALESAFCPTPAIAITATPSTVTAARARARAAGRTRIFVRRSAEHGDVERAARGPDGHLRVIGVVDAR